MLRPSGGLDTGGGVACVERCAYIRTYVYVRTYVCNVTYVRTYVTAGLTYVISFHKVQAIPKLAYTL